MRNKVNNLLYYAQLINALNLKGRIIIDDVIRDKLTKIDTFKEKIRKYRKNGLMRGGELSNENLVFKYLRRSGFMEKLSDLKTNTTDSILSLENAEL